MVSKILIICLAVLLVVCLSEVDAKGKGKGKGKGGKWKGHKHQCLGVDLEFSEESKKAYKSCHKDKDEKKDESEDDDEEGEGKKKGRKHDPCYFDCVYRKQEFITSDGKLDGDKIDAAIKKDYPEAAQAGILADEKECRKEVTEILTTDDDCKTFKKYGTCHWKAMIKNCMGKGHKRQCLGVDLEVSEESKTAYKSCHEKKEESEDEGEEGKKGRKHDQCFFDCVYRKKEWITSDGKLDGDKIDAAIKKDYPEAAQAGILADEKECRKEVTETLTTDDDCKTFRKYGACHWKAIVKNCKKEEKKEEE